VDDALFESESGSQLDAGLRVKHDSQDLSDLRARMRRRIERNIAKRDDERGVAISGHLSGLRRRLASLRSSCELVGEMPPTPPTLRGRIGARLVSVVRRTLFWLLPPLHSVLYEQVRFLEEELASMENLFREFWRLSTSTNRQFSDIHAKLDEWLRALKHAYQAELDSRIAKVERSSGENLRRAVARLEEEHAGFASQLHDRLQGTEQDVGRLRTAVEKQSSLLREMEKQLVRLLQPATRNSESAELRQRVDEVYLAFQNEFRGTRQDIRRRFEVYLPYVKQALVPAREALLDLGCGRGEWLELLREHGIPARGVDLNRAMIAECAARQLDAVEGEAVAYLNGVADSSLAMVTCFHVLEHLSYEDITRLLMEVRRVLTPGGLAIFETPNPQNILVASCNFSLDPTHRLPIPPATLRFLLQAHGFTQIEILALHPSSASVSCGSPGTAELVRLFNRYFYGPQDYAAIARRPTEN